MNAITRQTADLARPTGRPTDDCVEGEIIFWTSDRLALLITLVWLPLVVWVLWYAATHPRF